MALNLQTTNKRMTRREFLSWVWGVSLVALVGQAAVALIRFFQPRVTPGSFGGVVVAGDPQEFKPGTVSHVPSGRLYISRLDDGGVLALSQRCTHLGCTVPWRDDEGQFHCPCHSSLFNTKGEVVGGPAPRPLDLYPVSVKDGKLVVDTSHTVQRQTFEASQEYHPD